jgi:hypothetical protein
MMTMRPTQRTETQCLSTPDDLRQIPSLIANQICSNMTRWLIRGGIKRSLGSQTKDTLGNHVLGQTRRSLEILN